MPVPFLALLLLAADPAPMPAGSATLALDVGSRPLKVHTYKPANYHNGPLVLVFHGVLRNASEYRDHAKVIADRCGGLVAAPEFDEAHFPFWAYQRGGLVRDGKPQPRDQWTWSLVPPLADQLRARLGRPDAPYYLIGHSGGGQFLARLAGFAPGGAARIVAANPGSELFPTRDQTFGYGFGGLPDELSNDDTLKRYLAAPLTLYLGTNDLAATKAQDEHFDESAEGKRQGATRYERGKNVFREASELAKAKGWPFAWRLVEAPGVGHSAKEMFTHPNCDAALFGKPAEK
jgi:poly(3-hydroxybutyrate) depolymerase